MSRSGSRYPSAFGHTPSYRSYVKGDLVSQPIGYNVSLPGVSSYGLGSGRLGSASAFGANDLAPLNYGRSLVPGGDLSTSNSSAYSKQTQSSYSSYSDSSRDGGRPVVDYASESTLRYANFSSTF